MCFPTPGTPTEPCALGPLHQNQHFIEGSGPRWGHQGVVLPPDTTQAEGVKGDVDWSFPGSVLHCGPCTVHRERMNLKAPIYFSTGLTEKANHYYKLFITWTNQKIRKTFVQRNMFEFKHIKAFDRAFADNPGPMVRPWPGGAGDV